MSTLLPFYINVNTNGIPTISSNGINVTTTGVQYSFANHPNVGRPFRGLLIVRLVQAIPDVTTGTLPISFTSDGSNPVPLTGFNGEPVTAASIPGTGIYICWYERTTNTLQLLTGLV